MAEKIVRFRHSRVGIGNKYRHGTHVKYPSLLVVATRIKTMLIVVTSRRRRRHN